jgi:hypothetical protein
MSLAANHLQIASLDSMLGGGASQDGVEACQRVAGLLTVAGLGVQKHWRLWMELDAENVGILFMLQSPALNYYS